MHHKNGRDAKKVEQALKSVQEVVDRRRGPSCAPPGGTPDRTPAPAVTRGAGRAVGGTPRSKTGPTLAVTR